MRIVRRLIAIVAVSLLAVAAFLYLRPDIRLWGYSNILAADYVGPEACRECHKEKYDLWVHHGHSVMNQNPSPETVVGDFSGRRLDYAGGSVVFETNGFDYTMTLERDGALLRRYRVTRTVGSRIEQLYVGLQVEGPEPPDDPLYHVEHKLPFGYLMKREQWLPEVYFDPLPSEYTEDGALRKDPFDAPIVHTWIDNCLRCHNTYPYVDRLFFRSRTVSGFPPADMLGTEKLIDYAANELGPFYREHPEKNLVTLGISCESCHFGGREHVKNSKPMIFAPTNPHLRIRPAGRYTFLVPDRNDPYVINGICGQCHQANVSRYPNGSATWNSSEVKDLKAGACASEILCTHCHNPHKRGAMKDAPPDPEHIRACVRCHESYGDPEVARQHARHPEEAEVSCLDCHMPRYDMGLDRVVRSHTISSPGDPRMIEAGAPNACNLCHLDRSIRWVLDELEEGWGVTLERSPDLEQAYGGSLDTPVGRVWLESDDDALRKLASQSYGRSPLGEKVLPELVRALDDEYASNRLFTLMAIEQILDRRIPEDEYTVTAASEVRREQIDTLLESLGTQLAVQPGSPADQGTGRTSE